jgi:hypothetical protein
MFLSALLESVSLEVRPDQLLGLGIEEIDDHGIHHVRIGRDAHDAQLTQGRERDRGRRSHEKTPPVPTKNSISEVFNPM